MSQEQLAEAAGLDRSFVSLVERGIQTPNVVILLKVAEVLGVSASELIARVESSLGIGLSQARTNLRSNQDSPS